MTPSVYGSPKSFLPDVSTWIAAVLLGLLSVAGPPLHAAADQAPAGQRPGTASFLSQTQPIPYKRDEGRGVGILLARIGGGLLLVTVLALGTVVFAKRHLPALRGFSVDGKGRVQLLETRRITSKLTLFVIEFEGRTLLVAQSGDRIVELGFPEIPRGARGDRQ
jgi:hypothetical protein